ncbi:site-specific integrase [Vibrio parahaemolyticus]|nr:site-specific integrase [Vibrio parahaemolyticus]
MDINSGEMYEPFEEYVELLIGKGYSRNTIELYTGHTSRFLDFLYELRTVSIQQNIEFEPSKLFQLYHNFLTLGQRSSSELICQVAKNIGKDNETCCTSIASGIEASLSLFIELRTFDKDDDTFHQTITYQHNISHRHLNHMIKNSWFEATKRSFGNKDRLKIKLFRRAGRKNNRVNLKSLTKKKIGKSFPIEQSVQFFSNANISPASNFSEVRNFLLYALLAATGIRTSEALQVTVDDIDWDGRAVSIISPNERHNSGLTQKETEALADKGRATSLTFMIEPFAHIFWSYLKIYMEHHYKENVNHRFLFQKKNGRPFYCSDRSERSKALKKYLRNFDITLSHLGLHSFRHTYAFYTLNYFPVVDENGKSTNRQGLPMAYVKILMGHQNISSTEVYAKQDIDLVEFMLSAANSYIRDNGVSLRDLAVEYYERQLKELKREVQRLEREAA